MFNNKNFTKMETKYYSRITYFEKTKWGHEIQSNYFKTFEECYKTMNKEIKRLKKEKNTIYKCSINAEII